MSHLSIPPGKLAYANIGCGHKFHGDWVNLDLYSNHPDVIACNLLKGIPFPDNTFDVLYHCQVLEHIPRNEAAGFIQECYRVLKPGGIIRVVLPDLEGIAREYIKHLDINLSNPTPVTEANYDWLMIEFYDQTVRNETGGDMAAYFKQPEIVNEEYVMDRIGYVGRNLRDKYLRKDQQKKLSFKEYLKKVYEYRQRAFGIIRQKFFGFFMPKKERTYMKVGKFRLDGEVHYWMYDRYSLGKLLASCGFKNMEVKSPSESNIPNWLEYELDIKKSGEVYDPVSLFMEARK